MSRNAAVAVLLVLLVPARASGAPFDLDDWEQHLQELQAQTMREPGEPNPLLRLAEAYSQIGDSRQVEAACQRALERGAPVVQVQALLGEHYLRLNRFALAVDHLLQALEAGPKSAASHVLLWRALVAERRAPVRDGATSPVTLRQAMGLLSARGYYVPLPVRQSGEPFVEDPATARDYLGQGYQALRARDLRAALLGFQAAADGSPTLADAYRGMGIVLAQIGQPERAFAAYQLFLALEPEPTADVEEVQRIVIDYWRQQGARRQPGEIAR